MQTSVLFTAGKVVIRKCCLRLHSGSCVSLDAEGWHWSAGEGTQVSSQLSDHPVHLGTAHLPVNVNYMHLFVRTIRSPGPPTSILSHRTFFQFPIGPVVPSHCVASLFFPFALCTRSVSLPAPSNIFRLSEVAIIKDRPGPQTLITMPRNGRKSKPSAEADAAEPPLKDPKVHRESTSVPRIRHIQPHTN